MLRGSYICAFGLMLIAFLVSYQFSYVHATIKSLGLFATLFFIATYVFIKDIPFTFVSDKKILLPLCLLLFFILLSAFLSKTGERITGLIQIFLGILLIINIQAFVQLEGIQSFLKRLITFTVITGAFSFLYLYYAILIAQNKIIPFFGNKNLLGNYVGIIMLQSFYFVSIVKKPKNYLGYALIFFGFVLLLILKARAALIGTTIALFYASYTSENFLPFQKLKKSLPLKIGALAFILVSLFVISFKKGLVSTSNRILTWLNTLCLIRDNPLGSGPGSYEYVFLNYNGKCFPAAELHEKLIVANPHNMFLEFFAEIGIAGGALILLLLYFIVLTVKNNTAEKPLHRHWILSSLLLMGAVGMLEFPQDIPYTAFYICIVLGVAFTLFKKKKKLFPQFKIINLALSFILLFIYSLKALADHKTLFPDPDNRFRLACYLDKENWRGCSLLALTFIQEKEFEKAEKLIRDLSIRFEGHHSLMRVRGTLAEAKGDIPGACLEYKKLNSLYQGQSSKRKLRELSCDP